MVERDEMKEQIVPTKGDGHARYILAVILVCCFISMIALILAAVSLAKESSTTINTGTASDDDVDNDRNGGDNDNDQEPNDDDKIWTFAIGHDGTNLEYIHDLSGTLRGFHVDIVNAVCELANKDCRLVWDIYQNCWDAEAGQLPRGGVGLMAGWYDACTGWFNTYERSRTLSFTDPFRSGLYGVFYVPLGNPSNFNPVDVSGKKIAFLDGWATDEFCLARNDGLITGAVLNSSQIVHYATRDLILAAVNNGDVAAGFANDNMFASIELMMIGDKVTNCALSGGAMMMRKDTDVRSWWNPAFERLQESSKYAEICAKVDDAHGTQPGQTGDQVCSL